MNNLEILNEVVTMTSLEVCNLVNEFRKIEGNRTELLHKNFMASIRNEIGNLANGGVDINELKIQPVKYKDKKGEFRDCYNLDKQWIMQMLNKESALVRYKTQQYITTLEKALQNKQMITLVNEQQKQINELFNQTKELKTLIGIRCKTKYDYGQIIKHHLGIKVANDDYEVIKSMFFYEVGITKWEDLDYDRNKVKLLKEICKDYKPSKQIKFDL